MVAVGACCSCPVVIIIQPRLIFLPHTGCNSDHTKTPKRKQLLDCFKFGETTTRSEEREHKKAWSKSIRRVRLNAEVSGCKCGVFRNTSRGGERLSAKSFISCGRRTCGTAHGSRNSQPRKTSAAGHESVHAHPCRPVMRRPLGGQRRKPLPRLSTSPQVRSN